MFVGLVTLTETLVAAFVTRNASTQVPTDATGTPTARIYGPSGYMSGASATIALLDSANTDGLYSFSITPTGGAGFAAGITYSALLEYTVSAVVQSQTIYFTVT